jgi:uncharacterized protein YdhG (YjbR/CyaY superfamily)
MKKTKSAARSSMSKHSAVAKNTDEYLARVPEPARTTLKKLRAVILSAAPAEATEAISYGMPAFKYKGALVWFAAFAKHCSFFPGTSSLLPLFQSELKNFEISTGTIRFPVDKPLPATLVRKLVKARVAQNDQKKSR